MRSNRFGIGWRPSLAAATLAHLDRIDILEVIADDYFDAPAQKLRALRTLSAQAPVMLHGVGLGLATTCPIDQRRLDSFARLVDAVQPESWSEHLAFVRAGGIEIGHLAAPPRNDASIAATVRNIGIASRRIGSTPWMENIATLIDPPGSTMSEGQWLARIFHESEAGLLLDLHNVHTNSRNFGYDPLLLLDSLDLRPALTIHIAGGRMVEGRVLDDHLHDVPDPVYALLRYVAERNEGGLTVILERDGHYPSFPDLLAQLDQARAAVAA